MKNHISNIVEKWSVVFPNAEEHPSAAYLLEKLSLMVNAVSSFQRESKIRLVGNLLAENRKDEAQKLLWESDIAAQKLVPLVYEVANTCRQVPPEMCNNLLGKIEKEEVRFLETVERLLKGFIHENGE